MHTSSNFSSFRNIQYLACRNSILFYLFGWIKFSSFRIFAYHFSVFGFPFKKSYSKTHSHFSTSTRTFFLLFFITDLIKLTFDFPFRSFYWILCYPFRSVLSTSKDVFFDRFEFWDLNFNKKKTNKLLKFSSSSIHLRFLFSFQLILFRYFNQMLRILEPSSFGMEN